MIANEIKVISDIAATSAVILLVISLIFVILKIINKKWTNQSFNANYDRMKLPLYHVHTNAPKLAILLGIIHGFTVTPVNQSYYITGLFLVITTIILLILGGILGIKNNSKPMDEEKDLKWRTIRIIKWAFTVIIILFLFLHFI